MARPPRHSLPGAIYHVMLRGNNAQDIFYSDSERCRLCLFMQKGIERFTHKIVAFCFMTNHIHLAIQVGNAPLGRVVHDLASRYARFFNNKHQRTGHVFQGRFRSVLVDSRSYLRGLLRYIHLNPVRAGLVARPEHYRWSSHRAYLMQEEYTWLSPELGLANFGKDEATDVKAFHDFVTAGIGIEETINFDGGRRSGILGDDAFIDEVTKKEAQPADQPDLDIDFETLLSIVAQHYDVELAALQAPGRKPKDVHIRAVTGLLSRDIDSIPLHQVATFFGRDPSVISRAISKLETKLSRSKDVQHEIDVLSRKLLAIAAANT